MRCVVTAGPTYEELDDVRRMTNFSTGTLGSELANYLVDRGHTVELLLGYYSVCRIMSRAQAVHIFTTGENLALRLERLASPGVDAVYHAAAVGDFKFGKIWQRAPDGQLMEIESPKICTRGGTILAELTPTPKIISSLRSWFPKARLAGWKYELTGDRDALIARATRQLAENQTDVCVVNGLAYGSGFGWVTASQTCRHLSDKTELFDALLQLESIHPAQAHPVRNPADHD